MYAKVAKTVQGTVQVYCGYRSLSLPMLTHILNSASRPNKILSTTAILLTLARLN